MEARSEPVAMSSGESSDAKSIQRNPVQPQPPVYSMRLVTSSDGTAMYKSKSGNSPPPHPGGEGGGDGNSGAGGSPGLGVSTGEPFKRKRGRPRKYGSNGTVVVPLTTVSPTPSASALPLSSSAAAAAAAGAMKKVRGRPAGSSKKQRTVALGSAGIGFTPHIIAIKTGEDIASKIMAFSQQGPQAVCILSASGAVSNVTLRQAATSGGTVTYEVVAGSFIADGKKETTKMNPSEPVSAPGKLAGPVGVSQGTASESSDGPGSSLNQSIGACNNSNQQDLSNMPWQ